MSSVESFPVPKDRNGSFLAFNKMIRKNYFVKEVICMGGQSANQYNPREPAKSKDSKGNKPAKDDLSMPGQTYNSDKKRS